MTRLFLIRHGQTEWNRVERFRGHTDLELNETGIRQAEAAAAHLIGTPITAIYSSPLKRALHTAEIIGRALNVEVQPFPGLIDMHFGKWEGLSLDEARRQYPDLYALWEKRPHDVRFPDGDALPEVQSRVMAAVNSLLERHPNDSIAVVTHRAICKLLVLGLLGQDASRFWQIEQGNTAINIFEFKKGLAIAITINETCHLRYL